jgi:hypothetical protein
MKVIQSEDELAAEILKIKQANKFKLPNGIKKLIFPLNLFVKDNEGSHGYTYCHKIINYKGELLNIKSPGLLSKPQTFFRVWSEEKFKFDMIINSSVSESLNYESEMYIYLNEKNFPTLSSRQEISSSEITKNTVITERIKDTKNLADCVK